MFFCAALHQHFGRIYIHEYISSQTQHVVCKYVIQSLGILSASQDSLVTSLLASRLIVQVCQVQVFCNRIGLFLTCFGLQADLYQCSANQVCNLESILNANTKCIITYVCIWAVIICKNQSINQSKKKK